MSQPKCRTVVVMGASYGGAHASRLLSLSLPTGWRVVVIDRNSHMNHVYAFPRFSILSQHAPKGFVPLVNLLKQPPPSTTTTTSKPRANSSSTKLRPKVLPTPPSSPLRIKSPISEHEEFSSSPIIEEETEELHNIIIQGTIVNLTKNSVTITKPSRSPSSRKPSLTSSSPTTPGLIPHTIEFDGPEETIEFDYCIYALGSGMPDPVNVWSEHPNMPRGVGGHHEPWLGSKKSGIRWMDKKAAQLKEARRIVIVGGGALGIQFATDLKEVYPEKQITILHSRLQFMPLYPIAVHVAVLETLTKLGIEVVLGERVMTWPEEPEHLDGKTKIITTDKGRQFEADLVLPCTGQKPHVSLVAALSPSSISPTTSRIRVHPTLQISQGPVNPLPKHASTLEVLSNLSLKAPPTPPRSPNSALETSGNSHATNGDESEKEKQGELDHMFAIGDCAETGAIQAGHTAYYQGEVAVRNILSMIEMREGRQKKTDLESYTPSAPAIKVSLGLKKQVIANAEGVKVTYDGVEDLHSMVMWPSYHAEGMDVNE